MTSPRPPEQKKNSYEDDDFRIVLSELDEMDDEAETIMASARGKVSAIRKRQSNRIKIADKELQIPPALIRAVRSQRKLEKKIADIASTLPDDMVELYVDAAGQFSFIEPDAEHPDDTAAQLAARQRQAEIQTTTDAEQQQGTEVLDALTKH